MLITPSITYQLILQNLWANNTVVYTTMVWYSKTQEKQFCVCNILSLEHLCLKDSPFFLQK